MAKKATTIHLTAEDEQTLHEWIDAAAYWERMAERARIIFLAGEERGTLEIAQALATRPARVSKWRTRFAEEGIAGLENAERPGKPPLYDVATDEHILSLLGRTPPAGRDTWTGPMLAQALGNVSVDYVWRVLKKYGISLRGQVGSYQETSLSARSKVTTFSGLYLSAKFGTFVINTVGSDVQVSSMNTRGYTLLPRRDLSAEFKLISSGSAVPTLAEVVEWARSLLASAAYVGPRVRGLRDFLSESCARFTPEQLYAFTVGNTEGIAIPGLNLQTVSAFGAWLGKLESWLRVLWEKEERAGVQRLLAAIEEFVSASQLCPDGVFEWHLFPMRSCSSRVGRRPSSEPHSACSAPSRPMRATVRGQ
jgi:transposase